MGDIPVGGTAWLEREADRLHHILLGVWDDPLGLIQKFRIFFFKIIFIVEDDLLFRVFAEEFIDGSPQALQNVDQGWQWKEK